MSNYDENEDFFSSTHQGVVENEQIEFGEEYNVYERVGGQFQENILGELGTMDVNIDLRDPVQRFTQFTKTVAIDMIRQEIINLKRADIFHIIKQIPDIPNPKYKNPTAFVLGFWVTKKDGTINKERFKRLLSSLSALTYPIKDYDVIRYANLWIHSGLIN